ncbi:MAG: MFS transporter [Hyphomicrobiaceae bacterium]|nr:MFS transporter [Hyphomicrobiaceae bacterium]
MPVLSLSGSMISPMLGIVTALGITQIISWGAIFYAISVLAAPIAADTGWSGTVVYGGFSITLLAGGLIARPVGRFIDRHGGRVTMTIGSGLAALGLALLGLAPNPVVYLAAWALIGVASRYTLYDAAFATLVEVAGHGARRAISGLTLFGGLASTVFWPLTHALEVAFGWRATLLGFAVSVLVVCGALHWLVLPAKAEAAAGTVATASGGPTDPEPLIPPARRRFAMALLALALALNSFVFTALSVHMIPVFVGLGFAAGAVVWIASLKGVFQTVGRLIELLFGQRIAPTSLGVIATGFLPLAFLALVPFGLSQAALIAFAVFYGLSNGLVTIVRGGLPLVLFGRAGYASLLATIAAPGLILTAAAPTVFAALVSATGPMVGLGLLFVLSLVSFAATVVLARADFR